MYAIQQLNGKFIVPKYFWGDEPLPKDITVSAKPKLYETITEAEAQATRAEKYVLNCVNACCKRRVEAEQDQVKAERAVGRIEAKITATEVLPYVQVADKMLKLAKELATAKSELRHALYTIETSKRDEARWCRIYDAKFQVVTVGMSVDKVAA